MNGEIDRKHLTEFQEDGTGDAALVRATHILLWKRYLPDVRWARYRGSAAFRGTRNQETRTLNKQQSQSKSQYYSSILYSSKLDLLSSAAILFLLHTPAPNVTCGHPHHTTATQEVAVASQAFNSTRLNGLVGRAFRPSQILWRTLAPQ